MIAAPAFHATTSPRCPCGAPASAACCPRARRVTAAAARLPSARGRWIRRGALAVLPLPGARHAVPLAAALDDGDAALVVVAARTVGGIGERDGDDLAEMLAAVRAAVGGAR